MCLKAKRKIRAKIFFDTFPNIWSINTPLLVYIRVIPVWHKRFNHCGSYIGFIVYTYRKYNIHAITSSF